MVTVSIIIILAIYSGTYAYLYKMEEKKAKFLEKEYLKALEREQFLLSTMNDSLQVLEPKRFMLHRMNIAKFDPVEYEDKSCKV